MVLISKIKVGDIILAQRYKKKVKGEVVKLHPGSVVISIGDTRRVIDADKIIKILKQTENV